MTTNRENKDGLEEGSSQDSEIADCISELSERLHAGENLSLKQACELFPVAESKIRELWGILLVTNNLSKSKLSSCGPNPTEGSLLSGSLQNPTVSNQFHPLSPSSVASLDQLSLPAEFGDYQLIEQIGQGGMGIVFKAKQKSLGRFVALKLMRPDRIEKEEVSRRFRKEAESIAKLDHPNIVKIYDFGFVAGTPFISMEHIEGNTLDELVQNGVNNIEIANILKQVCAAISVAHKHNILHRDLKPSNILITKEGTAKVVDFGLAKSDPHPDATISGWEGTKTGLILGTPAYMAPEVAAGDSSHGEQDSEKKRSNKTSDVYSLGAILYYCLTKRPPFLEDTGLRTVIAVLEQEPPAPRSIEPTVDRDLEMIAMKCLQKPTELRYQSAESLEEDFCAFLENRPIKARSGRLIDLVAKTFGDSQNAVVLENWGLLWIWHSIVLLLACVLTTAMQWSGFREHWQYLLVWSLGFGTWSGVFWMLRRRMGPVTFIERQIAHIWAGSLIATISLFFLEWYTDRGPLELAPMLGVISAMIFLAKAGVLSGLFYFQTIAMLITSIPMAIFPLYAHLIFGVVSSACFFIPGLKYYRKKRNNPA